MCECNKIGGPWVTVDPDCPAHGAVVWHVIQETQ